MAWVCGMIAHKCGKEVLWKNILGAAVGAITYVILYLGKTFIESYFIMGIPMNTVWITVTQKGLVSTVNGIIAAAVSVPLYMTLRPLLKRAKLL
jgi:Na+/H+ antiporter NhaA